MADLTETATFTTGVFQLETTTPALGGPGGVMNSQAQALANRTQWLKQQVEARLPTAGGIMTGHLELPASTPSMVQAARRDYVDRPPRVDISSGSTLDWNAGTCFVRAITGNITFAFTNVPTGGRAQSITFRFYYVSGIITWPAGILWANGAAPSGLLAERHNLVVFTTDDGASILGSYSLNHAAP